MQFFVGFGTLSFFVLSRAKLKKLHVNIYRESSMLIIFIQELNQSEYCDTTNRDLHS